MQLSQIFAFFNIGGIGGFSGHYYFIQSSLVDSDNLPSKIKINGMSGEDGKNARICRTKALDVTTDSWMHAWVALFVPGWTLNTDFYKTPIDDPECPDHWVRTSENVQVPSLPQKLDITIAINGYQNFLVENIKSPIQSIIRKSIDSIKHLLSKYITK